MVESPYVEPVSRIRQQEEAAVAYYEEASARMTHPMGRILFEQLALFEKYHLHKLTALEESLRKKQDFIKYERHELPTIPRKGITEIGSTDLSEVLAIIQIAINREISAEKDYLKMADEITDPDGHYMFSRLSEEEHLHFHILKEAWWSLNSNGSWEWTIR